MVLKIEVWVLGVFVTTESCIFNFVFNSDIVLSIKINLYSLSFCSTYSQLFPSFSFIVSIFLYVVKHNNFHKILVHQVQNMSHLAVGLHYWSFFCEKVIFFLVLHMLSNFGLNSGHCKCYIVEILDYFIFF